ncbi:ferrous iron transport protein B [Paratissierella segnis]|jgi:ferrous iron transport protein B|uniref:Ferrous iron transport protein B n=1 Tax=Paratissierella segnis TaxID=2763679 RepID=A0A926ESC3_9FIRM|nr:ferrous iron transport protein B [Paratissierella segnis]MBC8587333.1 ferrous iron transport protein B [Paratissierella segnis]
MNTIALVGNPNSGKTTLFNAITGANQHVGNWPGVTVEKKVGEFKFNNKIYDVVDLPGTYSLGAFSEDEVVARDYVVKGNPDVVINVVDATNIERNLYLTTQLLEMGANVVIALNMVDEAKTREIEINIESLSKNLGVPVISTVASKKSGVEKLIEKTVECIEKKSEYHPLSYGENIDKEIKTIKELLKDSKADYPADWIAIKLLEGNKDILEEVNNKDVEKRLTFLKDKGIDYELEIVDKRYDFISNITKKSVVKPDEAVVTLSDKIDKVITNKYLGLPIFGLIMFIVFQLTFKIGQDLLGGIVESWIETFGVFLSKELVLINAPEWLISFISDGIIGGVGAVLSFIPLITVLYFFLGVLEDTGYMARAAYIMDDIMRALGLQGKTFISMIIGFGCNVPGIMATRTLETKKDKMIAILINPFMSCGARIPIYLVFISAFFPEHGGIILFILYFLGILVALIMGKIFSNTLFKGESSHFIMELPPYRLPSFNSVIKNMWQQVLHFIERAGTIIFAVVAILWILSVLPLGVEPYSQASLLGKIGTLLAPIFKPAGFGTWQASVSLAAGIAAKEAVVAVLGMVYAGVSEGSELIVAIQNAFTPLTAVSFMVMVLLYTPCAATIATVKQETNSYKWAIFISVYTFALAWIASVLVYQIGSLLGF